MSPSSLNQAPSSSADSSALLSIKQLTLRHCRERLLVKPLFWTNRHLELLQCSFSEIHPAPPLNSTVYTGERRGGQFVTRLWKRRQLLDREYSVVNILAHSDCPLVKGNDKLPFYFSGRSRSFLHCAPLFLRGNFDTCSPLIAAYVDQQHLQLLRSDAVRPHIDMRSSRNRATRIAITLQRIRVKRLTPAEPLHDPYIAALLIAVAQEQYKQVLEWSNDIHEDWPRPFVSHVFFSFPRSECLYLYTADISSTFLDQFNRPAIPPSTKTVLSIRVTNIPFKPLKTLRGRLLALVLPTEHGEMDKKQDVQEKGAQDGERGKGQNVRDEGGFPLNAE
ncbi:hypothetical protein CP532_5668 [Ophiocordyceps camponoti-leonardi (nom. inval.)]|nr:hypothetical protein CP532_5668 [Ophiocordyceps camponoti-leonardi (nom. inval.)]